VVECDVEGARVSVDGRDVGRLPYAGERPAGTYLVEVTAEGYEPYAESVEVQAEQETTMRVSLITAGPEGLDPLWFWTGVGVTGAFALTTIGVGAAAGVTNSDAEDYLDEMVAIRDEAITNHGADPATWPESYTARIDVLRAKHGDTVETADALEIATWVMLGLTAAAAGGTVYLYLESARLFGGSEADITFAPIPTEGGAGLAAIGRF
jgi:hypothetical protein